MRPLLLFILLFSSGLIKAQQFPFYSNYKLEKNPTQITREITDEPYYFNKYLLTIEYEYDYNAQQFYKYHTEHYRVKLNTDLAIEEYNKIYVAMEDVEKVVKVQARVIKKNEVLEETIVMEEFLSEEEDEKYNYFPVSGLELGDELEIFYVLKMQPKFNGDQFHFQGEAPIYNFDFRFIVPNDSYFDFLAHNGLPTPIMVDTILQRHQYDIHLDTIPAVESEYFSVYKNVTMKLDASLSKIVDEYSNIYSPYNSFIKYVNSTFNTSLSSKTLNSLKKLNNRIGVNSSNSEKENVRKIENYMKNEFLIGYGDPNLTISEMIKKGKANGAGSLKLFMALFTQANIDFQCGMVSDRYDSNFSTRIESEYFLQNYFIYFPKIDSYLAPLDFSSRLDYMDDDWVPNNGLFLTFEKNPYRKSTYEVKPIKGTTAAQNRDSTIIIIDVNKDLTDAVIRVERYITGYDAGEHQVYYNLYSESKKKEIQDDLLNVFNDNSRFKMTSIENVEVEDAFVKPLIIKGDLTFLYVPLFEKAGDKTIFRLGEIFGDYIDPLRVVEKKSDFVFSHAFMRSIEVRVNFKNNVEVTNTETVPVFENLVELENTNMRSEFYVTPKQIIYRQRDEYHSNHYQIDAKDDILTIFHFHNNLGKVNLIIEE